MKKILFVLFITLIIILTGCVKEENKVDYNLIFSEKTSSNYFALIYEFGDGRKLYSEFSNIKYKQKNIDAINLATALEEKLITLDEILLEMEHIADYNDGGSKMYSFSKTKNDVSNINFMLVKCKTITGNENIIIGTSENIIEKCSDE